MPTICQIERFCAPIGIVVSMRNMPDNLTPAQRHNNMAAIHSASTTPERKLRHALWRLGFRYRVNDQRLPSRSDIVLPKYRAVIFVHCCFWHGYKDCKYYTVPKGWPRSPRTRSGIKRFGESWRQKDGASSLCGY